jgi:hypothetical protein
MDGFYYKPPSVLPLIHTYRFASLIYQHAQASIEHTAHFTHHRMLLTTLAAMIATADDCPCATFQLTQQIAFI